MSNSKTPQDVDLLKSDIASFSSTLGFAADSSTPYSGFNDVDFRKPDSVKPSKPPKKHQPSQSEKKTNNTQTPKTDKNISNNQKPKPKPPVLSLEDNSNKSNTRFGRETEKFKNLPLLPLARASALSLWYEDELELENKVFGDDGKGKRGVDVRNVMEIDR